MEWSDALKIEADGWLLAEAGFDPDRAVAIGSNFMCGNGYLGYRATSAEQAAADYVALVVTDTYDCADGHWRELTTAPNPLLVAAHVGGAPVTIASGTDVEWALDLTVGETWIRFVHEVPASAATTTAHRLHVDQRRIASYDELHVVAQRWTATADPANTEPVTLDLVVGIDAGVWSLNGQHLPLVVLDELDGVLVATGTTIESRIDVAVASNTTAVVQATGRDGEPERRPIDVVTAEPDGRRLVRPLRVDLAPGASIVVDTVGAVASSNDVDTPGVLVTGLVEHAATLGYDALVAATRRCWDAIWSVTDVRIEGDAVDDVALRFSAYHNRICTPAHDDRLPIGARGLSCQAYQGSAFWDQEVYNLPAFLLTEPEIARSILAYRHHTLDGARRKAARLGYAGAFFAWISGTTGDELCPDHFFTDVLTGRPIRNHFNVWQMHIAPDVVTMIARYVEVTGDVELLVEHGAEVAFEVARFLHSFVRYDEWRGVYHCIRLLGPDEWHENVDDNAFTNYQVASALRFAIDTHELLARERPDDLARIAAAIDLDPAELDGWRRVRDRILLPSPGHDGLIEQFAGFFQLEDVSPADVRARLLHPQEYWGWPNGVAVATQVSKQADVAMLLWLHGHRFDAEIVRRNYEYYEARCAHGSSLSHAAHGMVAARLGDAEAAHRHFRETALVDLANTQHAVVGGTFIGGIHTAACGGTYQLAVNGLGGLDVRAGRLRIDPVLPTAWTSLRYPVTWRGARIDVTVGRGPAGRLTVAVTAAVENTGAVELVVLGTAVTVDPGTTISTR